MKIKGRPKLSKAQIKHIRLYTYYDNWLDISCNYALSEDFIREFQDKLDWIYVSAYQNLSENFIREFQDKVSWHYISLSQNLSEDFIREFQDKVNWEIIKNPPLEFIEEFQDKIGWDNISKYNNLSEEFIEKFQDKVNWDLIFTHQKLSINFISRFQHKTSGPICIFGLKEQKKMKKPTDTNLKEAWLDYKAENYPDEDWAEIINPVRVAFEAGWDEAVSYFLQQKEK